MKYLIILLIFSHSIASRSAINTNLTPVNNSSKPLNSRAGDCVQGKQTALLEVNNIRAMLLNSGDLWWNRSTSQYEAPKRSKQQIEKGQRAQNPLFAGSVWVSGKSGGNLRMAAITFSGSGRNAWWPGAIRQGESSIDKRKCEKFDRYWNVTSEEITRAINKEGISASILEWPGRGNPYLISKGLATAEELSEPLAPFYDSDGDCIYNPERGDLPSIKNSTTKPECNPEYFKNKFTFADQMIFWVINDLGNAHTGPSSTPIGAQMNCLAFAFKSSDELNDMTFYSYDIYNKSNVTLEETYMSQYMDSDLGNYSDDLVGCDTNRSIGFVYNGDDNDETTTVQGYGDQPPIFAADFFEGPKKSNGEPIGLTSFLYYINANSGQLTDPGTEIEFRNFQEGFTKNGANLTVSNDCLTAGFPTTKFCFYGDPSKPGEWSMCDAGFIKTDLRWLQNSGPFDMKSGGHETITIGCIFVRPPRGSHSTCRPAMRYIQEADDKAQRLFDFQFKNTPGPDAPDLKIIEAPNTLHLILENAKTSNNYGENYSLTNINVPLFPWNKDSTYKFEGYMIYQVVSENAISTLADLKDNSKAKLIKIMDKKNNISRAVNYKDDYVDGKLITLISEDLSLPNTGIEPELKITKDFFQFEGQTFLVNNKTYYYATVAFGYNNYRHPTNFQTDFQRTQLNFSNSIKIFKATPHNNDFWGVKTNADYNQPVPVTRLQGQGHGRYFLDFNDSNDELEIVNSGSKDEITYKAGRSPFVVKITDPFKVKNASFKLTMSDSAVVFDQNRFKLDSTSWSLEINDGSTQTIYSEGKMDRAFSQSVYANINSKLESYGISVANGYADTLGTVLRNGNKFYGFVGAEIVYKNPDKQWLRLVKDKNATDYEDWVKSGTISDNKSKYQSAFTRINNEIFYTDKENTFGDILEGGFAPYCLASNSSVKAIAAENSYQSFAPGFKWRRITDDSLTMVQWGEGPENNLDSIYSVDLVITNDKSKWSRAVVFETGESQQFNEGNALKGQLRQAASVDQEGFPETTGKGLGWFPGYAINLETGVRMNVYFGENSRFRGRYAANMIWDPDTTTKTVLGNPLYGGSQFIYVMNTDYDNGARAVTDRDLLQANFNAFDGAGLTQTLNTRVASLYRTIAWTCMPLLARSDSFYTAAGVYQIPGEVKIKVRVEKPYNKYKGDQSIYTFNTLGLAPVPKDSLLKSAFENVTVVPNPYYAFSAYELNANQNIVKIVNVPKNSTVSIFTTDGMLVRKLKLDASGISDGQYGGNVKNINYDNTIDWDLRTTSGILVASGMYYINIEAPGLGNKVLKLFATMRSADVSNF